MRNFSISLYGNLILDKILFLDKFPDEGVTQSIIKQKISLGGIFNTLRFLSTNPNLEINIHSSIGDDLAGDTIRKILDMSTCEKAFLEYSNENTSTAFILNNLKSSERTGLVQWGACCNMKNFVNDGSGWKHFSYCDSLYNLNRKKLKTLSGIKSLDLNKFSHSDEQRQRTLDCIQAVDFVITSIEESLSITESKEPKEACKKLGRLCNTYAIIHHPGGSFISNGTVVEEVKTKIGKIDNLNVLGAGDIFVGSFIKNYSNLTSIKDVVLKSHHDTFNWLAGQ